MQNPKCNIVAVYLSAFAKILQKDVNKDQKRHWVDTRDSTTHKKASERTKSILRRETTKISIKMQKKKKIEWDVPGVESGK